MGLENLKSVFSEEAGINNSKISGRYEEDRKVQPMEDIFGNRTSAVDFFGGTNSYKPTLDISIPGFTRNFDVGGYTFGDGQVGNSKYLDISSDTQTRTIGVDISSLTTPKLGFGDFVQPDFEGNDTRFVAGLGWPLANSILQLSHEGSSFSLFYTTTDGKVSVGASGVADIFGPINDSSIAQAIGVEIPPLDFSVDIFGSKPLRYEDTIWEKNNFTPNDIGSDLPPGYLGNQQGIVFQTITPNVNRAVANEKSAPGLDPISTLNDLYEGTKAGHGAERGTTANEIISQMNTGLHYYLGNQTSFVKLGPDIYQGSILDALSSGDIGYVKEKIADFAVGVGNTIIDKSGDIAISLGKTMLDWASSFRIETDLPNLTTLAGQFSLKGLKGPSVDLPSLSFMGGFFDGIQLPNLSLPSLPDINLPDIDLPSLPSLPSFGVGKKLSGLVTISGPPFPFTEIKANPELLDLLGTIKNDITGFAKAQTGFQQGLLGDAAGSDGSHSTDNVNPRSLPPKVGILEDPQLPYKSLGNVKYTDAIISKHPTSDEEDGFQYEKVLGDFYPSTTYGGDLKTLLPKGTGKTLKEAGKNYDSDTYVQIAEGEKYGLPFYFKDLRDNKYIIFRGYLSGMTQDVQPSWTETSYLGRSENAYIYGNTKRTINFTFKVFATTKPELQLIYEKLNQLTKLTYPRYKDASGLKNRMMAPLCSLRIGELFGNNNRNVTGFVDSLSFNWPDDTTWETEKGKRVPKQCDITVSYTVLHKEPPSYDAPDVEFFGFSL